MTFNVLRGVEGEELEELEVELYQGLGVGGLTTVGGGGRTRPSGRESCRWRR